MKSITRWVIVIAVLVVIALLIWLLTQGRKQEAEIDTGAMQKPAATTAPVAPPEPKPVEPVKVTVLFDYDRSVLRSGETAKLGELVTRFKERAFDRVDAIGHADRIGPDAYNMQLSGRRAEAVQSYLVGNGVEPGKVRVVAKGESEAMTGEPCKDMGAENRKNKKLIDCLQPDRRVEITLVPAR